MKLEKQAIPELSIYHYQFLFTCQERVRLPKFSGSAWRGALGHALKRTVCVVRNTPCSACMLKGSCAYSYIFETPPPQQTEKMRKYSASPHPFVLQFPLDSSNENGSYALNLILVGKGQRFFPYLVHALQRAGQEGIGSNRQIFLLDQVAQLSAGGQATVVYQDGQLQQQNQTLDVNIPPLPECIEITLHTPLRIKQNGRNLNPQSFNFGAFFGNLLRRISMLSYFHGDTPLETDFAGMMQRARTIEFNARDLHWFDWKRYSSRQKTEMNMGGVIGSVTLDMKGMEAFWPYLWLGQWTHAGKGTSMGMGHYSIDSTSLPDNR
ncbi:CRISPR system precrRNA processing endoribonuclease RAMP protein Cas6 [Methylomarinum sp. Ch1-1]|uniref:CRISPR system precrRNA processing endoribonuclease RAMP protein Cas6 n=1 Tax=Methylomarinum roseum TaxID=3067653 RepID=A0AAU7NQ18_9GAMM|nr:CRISPR system precrRNA processing endoribonuclease RAMP protein Cas6 [Methylomarinum sp. Ch1-1]MDP4521021.1 CRISPR system precrRNA processing endoribonuclease RAMP protein Cas6 [Methylomarinum sp. Ch1-1]